MKIYISIFNDKYPFFFCQLTCTLATGELNASSEKKKRDPLKIILALFLACRAAIRTVFRPTA